MVSTTQTVPYSEPFGRTQASGKRAEPALLARSAGWPGRATLAGGADGAELRLVACGEAAAAMATSRWRPRGGGCRTGLATA